MEERIKPLLNHFPISAFQQTLVNWFEQNMRQLPWREDRDPYKVWVSEIMLQQTQVDTVMPYFENFIQQFPTLDHLAAADEEEVLKAWEGLGYYSRARHLHQAVREVKEKYGGRVPDQPRRLRSLPGIGPYTAGAILSIAYGKKEPAVDGNVMRVMSRIFEIEDDISRSKTRALFDQLIRQLIPEGDASYFNQGLMELGALVCTPGTPQCLTCPVREYCRAQASGKQEALPVKQKKKKPRLLRMAAGVLLNENTVLIRRRPDHGLLAKLYEFPNVEWSAGEPQEAISTHIFETYGIKCAATAKYNQVQHTFTHLVWDITVFEMRFMESWAESELPENHVWADLDDLSTYPFPVSHQKIIEQLLKRHTIKHA